MKNILVTIPRLELQAALIASRIKVTILDQMDMPIDSVFLWSDSKTVLNYLRNGKPIPDHTLCDDVTKFE